MPELPISQLPSYTTPTDNDLLVIVDIANNITKQIKKSDLLSSLSGYIPLAGNSSDSPITGDLFFTSQATTVHGNYTLQASGVGFGNILLSAADNITIAADGIITFGGPSTLEGVASYNSDLSSSYTTRSLIDKGYADSTYSKLTSLSAASPLAYNNTTGAFSIQQASGSQNGYLSSTDWTTFNNKQNTLTTGNLTEATSSVLTIIGGTGAIIGSGLSVQVKQASGSQAGYLSSTDWTVFNNKQNTLTTGNLTETTSSVLTITGGTGAIIGSGLSVQVKQASSSQAGYLSSTDWTAFNNKLSANQTITLSGDITGSGTTAITTGVAWANGESTYDARYVQLTDNSVQTLTGTVTASSGSASGFDYNHSLTLSGTATAAHLFGLSPTLVAGANNNALTNLYLNATYTNGSFTGVSNWALNVNTGSIKVNAGFVQLNTISLPATPASGLVDIYSNSGVPSWIQSDGTVRAFAATNVDNSFSSIQTFNNGLSTGDTATNGINAGYITGLTNNSPGLFLGIPSNLTFVNISSGSGFLIGSGSQFKCQSGATFTQNTTFQANATVQGLFAVQLGGNAIATQIRGFGSGGSYTQTSDLTEWQSYNGTTATTIAKVDNNGNFYSNSLTSVSSGLTFTALAQTGSSNITGYSNSYYSGLGTGTGTESYHAFYSSVKTTSGSTAQTNITRPLIIGTVPASSDMGLWMGVAAGSQTAANAAISFITSSGFINLNCSSAIGNGINLQYNGSTQLSISATGVTIASPILTSATIIASAPVTCNNFLSKGAGSNVVFGGQDQLTNPNLVGGNVTVQAGKGTGNATPSQIIIQGPLVGSSSSTLQLLGTLATHDTVNGNILYSTTTTQVGSTIRGFGASGSYTQTGDLTQWQSYNGTTATTIAKVDKSGNIITTGYLSGAMVNPRRVQTTTYTILSTDSVVEGNATSAAFTITLPDATVQAGAEYTVVKNDSSANAVTVGTTSSQTINYVGTSATTYILSAQWNLITVYSNGTNWIVLYKQ